MYALSMSTIDPEAANILAAHIASNAARLADDRVTLDADTLNAEGVRTRRRFGAIEPVGESVANLFYSYADACASQPNANPSEPYRVRFIAPTVKAAVALAAGLPDEIARLGSRVMVKAEDWGLKA